MSRPLAVPVSLWALLHERRILRSGRELDESESVCATGVVELERVRILAVPCVPNPFDRISGLVRWLTGYSIFNPSGMTLRYGIYVVDGCERDLALIVHELAHVAQYERFGMFGFMRRYIFECLADGYENAPLEMEACELTISALAAGGDAPDGSGEHSD